jgi:hypothetical protein
MTTATNYKGRVWTCDEHHQEIEALIQSGKGGESNLVLTKIHPKRGNSCKECARLYDETPPCNR